MKSFDFNEIVKRKSQQTPAKNVSKECQQTKTAKTIFLFFSPVLSCCCLRPSYIYRDYFLVCSQAK